MVGVAIADVYELKIRIPWNVLFNFVLAMGFQETPMKQSPAFL